jgi:hypothetical protein
MMTMVVAACVEPAVNGARVPSAFLVKRVLIAPGGFARPPVERELLRLTCLRLRLRRRRRRHHHHILTFRMYSLWVHLARSRTLPDSPS